LGQRFAAPIIEQSVIAATQDLAQHVLERRQRHGQIHQGSRDPIFHDDVKPALGCKRTEHFHDRYTARVEFNITVGARLQVQRWLRCRHNSRCAVNEGDEEGENGEHRSSPRGHDRRYSQSR
jgi:hypothetical protein